MKRLSRWKYESKLVPPDQNEPLLLEPLSPTGGPLSPQTKPKYHGDECFCSDCHDIRAAIANYIAARKLFETNGF